MKILIQLIGLVVLLFVVALGTIRFEHRNADGASILFPGGELVSGELYSGPEPDWGFTDEVNTIELQLFNPVNSRRIWIIESAGKAYVVSGYMNSFLGRLWKEWAIQADSGDGRAVIRINDIRYERRLRRIETGPELAGVAEKLESKYGSANALAEIQSGSTWVFELRPIESVIFAQGD